MAVSIILGIFIGLIPVIDGQDALADIITTVKLMLGI